MGLRKWMGLRKSKVKPRRPPMNALLWSRAEESAADFVGRHLQRAILFESREPLCQFVIDEAPKDGLLLEFGVFKGASINRFARFLRGVGDQRKIWGFDAFQGLQEHWHGIGYHRSRNEFNRGGALPEVADNVELVPGWIDETLPIFLDHHPGLIALVHIDTDTYKPAKTILSLCKSRLQEGSLILFDELFAFPGWENDEYRALTEELPEDAYEWIAFGGQQGLLRITRQLMAHPVK